MANVGLPPNSVVWVPSDLVNHCGREQECKVTMVESIWLPQWLYVTGFMLQANPHPSQPSSSLVPRSENQDLDVAYPTCVCIMQETNSLAKKSMKQGIFVH